MLFICWRSFFLNESIKPIITSFSRERLMLPNYWKNKLAIIKLKIGIYLQSKIIFLNKALLFLKRQRKQKKLSIIFKHSFKNSESQKFYTQIMERSSKIRFLIIFAKITAFCSFIAIQHAKYQGLVLGFNKTIHRKLFLMMHLGWKNWKN